jgi:pimeloyl-ACP methyl ester carboxylesterase
MMKRLLLITTLILFFQQVTIAQQKGYIPKIEPCDCAFKVDSNLKTRCAYLIVPENRQKPNGKTIKLPFIYVESGNPNKRKDPVLYTGGGPGASSLRSVRGSYRRALLKNRDYIAFEQRGTQFALPCLECGVVDEAVKTAYRKNLNIDSMVLEGVKMRRKRLLADGIDLSAYNTEESAADIEDLRRALKIDSLNLMGISYSGGLMMTVLKNYPQGVRSLILDSPLPEFINIDEEELINFNEALDQVFLSCQRDSLDKEKYANLRAAFREYLTSIGRKKFTISYREKNNGEDEVIHYSRNELISVVKNALEDYPRIKDVPFIITELIKGNHQLYIKALLDGVFSGNSYTSAMRLSVYCSDKMAYARPSIIAQQEEIYPYMAGFHVNDVYGPLCDCWKVPAINASVKMPFYSNVPVLLGAGGFDDACRPVYNDMIHHYMPNSQRLLFVKRPHAPLLNSRAGDPFISQFLDHPYKKIESDIKDVIAY